MGLEAGCVCRFGKQTSEGKAHLDSDHLLFRGDFRLKVLFKDMKAVRAENGELTIATADGSASFALGAAANKWAEKILHPPSRLDKLGVKPETRVLVLGVEDESFHDELRDRQATVLRNGQKETDLLFFAAHQKADLKKLPSLQASLKDTGAIWVIYPKGIKEITEADVMSASKAAGFVDTKVCSFSPTHTGLKLMIPVAKRKSAGRS
jgi:hypothetical protein